MAILAALSAPFWIAFLWMSVEPYESSNSMGALLLQTIVVGCMILIIATILIAPILLVAQSLGGAWESRRGKAAKASGDDT